MNNPTKKQIAARFITKKLWEFLAHPNPPATVLDAIAPTFAADMDLRNLVRLILTRPEFYSATAKQGLVRTPIEYIVALVLLHRHHPRSSSVSHGGPTRPANRSTNPRTSRAGGPTPTGSTPSALAGRADFARSVDLASCATPAVPFEDNNVIYNKTVPDAVDFVAAYFGIHPLSTTTRNALIAAHQAERNATPWKNWAAPTNLLTMTMLAPEFHMA